MDHFHGFEIESLLSYGFVKRSEDSVPDLASVVMMICRYLDALNIII